MKIQTKRIVIMLTLLFILSLCSVNLFTSYATDIRLTNIEDVENAIKNGTLSSADFEDFKYVSSRYLNSEQYMLYLTGIEKLMEHNYKDSIELFERTIGLARNTGNTDLELLALEKSLELNDALGRIGKYQEQAYRLKDLSIGRDDFLYLKALHAVALSNFISYNDDAARSYLDVLYEESTELSYAYGLARYHELQGDLAFSYDELDEAHKNYEAGYAYALQSDRILAYPYAESFQIKIAQVERAQENYQSAFDRLHAISDDQVDHCPVFLRELHYEDGILASLLGDQEDSLLHLETALKYEMALQDIPNSYSLEADIYNEFGYTYYEMEDYKKASDYFIKAYDTGTENYSDKDYSAVVSELSDYETRELERELQFKNDLRVAQEHTIQVQRRFLTVGSVLIVLLIAALMTLLRINNTKEKIKKKLYLETITDHMTNVYNRNHIIEMLEDNLDNDLCILMADVDNFKNINDTHGHLVGDEVLIKIAETIKNTIRPEDFVGRYGGEEFLIILRNTKIEDGSIIAERIRGAVEQLQWDRGIVTTLSMGLVENFETNSDSLLYKADKLMYEAKRNGKNQVVC